MPELIILLEACFTSFLTTALLAVPDLGDDSKSWSEQAQYLDFRKSFVRENYRHKLKSEGKYFCFSTCGQFGLAIFFICTFSQQKGIAVIAEAGKLNSRALITQTEQVQLFLSLSGVMKKLLLLALLFAAALVDQRLKIVPNLYIIVALILTLVISLFELACTGEFALKILQASFLTSTITLVLLILLFWASRAGVGAGDIKLIYVMAWLLPGKELLLTLLASELLLFLWTLISLCLARKSKADTVPLAPFLLLGTLAALGLQTIFP